MTTKLVPAASARRRARAALTVALLAIAALWLAGVPHLGPGDDSGTGLALHLVIVGVVVAFPYLARAGRPRLDDQRYLTARTVSGWRTVDLHELMKVGHFWMPGMNLLVLVDVNDVRLMLDKSDIDEATRQVLADQSHDAVHVSPGAEHWLGLSVPSGALQLWWVLRALGSLLLLNALWFGSFRLAALVAESAGI
jgi:hypothetical protein